MSLLDSQTQKRKRSPETSEVFDSLFGFLMDFTDKALSLSTEPLSMKMRRTKLVMTSRSHRRTVAMVMPGELFDKLPVEGKDVLGEIVGNTLDNLPEDGIEAFLVRCFNGLFPKLSRGAQRVIKCRMIAVPPQSQEASTIQSAPESSLAFPSNFPKDDLVRVGMSVNYGRRWQRHPGRVA